MVELVHQYLRLHWAATTLATHVGAGAGPTHREDSGEDVLPRETLLGLYVRKNINQVMHARTHLHACTRLLTHMHACMHWQLDDGAEGDSDWPR